MSPRTSHHALCLTKLARYSAVVMSQRSDTPALSFPLPCAELQVKLGLAIAAMQR